MRAVDPKVFAVLQDEHADLMKRMSKVEHTLKNRLKNLLSKKESKKK